MLEVEEYRVKFEAIKERLEKSNGEGDGEVRELKERLGTVRDSLQRKQETIDSQNAEIVALREKSAQLSDMLGQALAAFEAQSQGGVREIIQSIDSEFVGLLADEMAQPEPDSPGDGGQRGPAPAEADSEEVEDLSIPSEDTQWEPENEAPPALQRILGRRKR